VDGRLSVEIQHKSGEIVTLPPCRVERATLLGVEQEQIVAVRCPLCRKGSFWLSDRDPYGFGPQVESLVSLGWYIR